MKDFMIMFLIIFTAGLLSTMNVWVTKTSDIRFSLNDVYMALLMTGWMFFIMGLYYQYTTPLFFGLSLILFSVWLIRTQQLINLTQYKLGMIPHHSMAIHMSKKLLEQNPPNEQFLLNLIHTQEKEIEYLKSL
jgi:acyl-coenzyme A synthetase/AMP-(fatty) acid ligase